METKSSENKSSRFRSQGRHNKSSLNEKRSYIHPRWSDRKITKTISPNIMNLFDYTFSNHIIVMSNSTTLNQIEHVDQKEHEI